MRRLLVGLAWLFWAFSTTCWADERTVEVQFLIEPAGAKIFRFEPGVNSPDHLILLAAAGETRPLRLDCDGREWTVIVAYGDYQESTLLSQRSVCSAPRFVYSLNLPWALRWKLRLIHWGPPAVGILVVSALLWTRLVRPRLQKQEAEAARGRRWAELEARADATDPLLTTRLGAYRIVERLGAGGMAAVYRAVPDDTLEEKEAVAIKVIHFDLAKESEYQRRFRREIQVCRQLKHPNIVRVNDFGEQEGLLYLVMELVGGTTLRERIVPGGLPIPEALRLIRAIAEPLAYAHEQEVVHRDLKPENVMITPEGRIVVMDFGLARQEDLSALTATGALLGTPAYVSPEQIVSEPATPLSDQYALGILAYELFTGQIPFDALEPVALLFKHLQEVPEPPSKKRADFPAHIEGAILTMLAKKPEERFPDVRAAVRAMEWSG